MSDLLPLVLGLIAGLVLAAAPFSARVRRLRTDLRQRDTALAAAREELRGLQEDLEAARLRPTEDSAEILADNADLRRRMDELADALIAQSRAGEAQPVASDPSPSVAPPRPPL